MNGDEKPITKKDLFDAIGGLEGRINERVGAMEERLREYVHDTETSLLTAFHKFSTANDTRVRSLEGFQSTATQRLAELEAAGRLSALELRVAEIEKKLDRRQ